MPLRRDVSSNAQLPRIHVTALRGVYAEQRFKMAAHIVYRIEWLHTTVNAQRWKPRRHNPDYRSISTRTSACGKGPKSLNLKKIQKIWDGPFENRPRCSLRENMFDDSAKSGAVWTDKFWEIPDKTKRKETKPICVWADSEDFRFLPFDNLALFFSLEQRPSVNTPTRQELRSFKLYVQHLLHHWATNASFHVSYQWWKNQRGSKNGPSISSFILLTVFFFALCIKNRMNALCLFCLPAKTDNLLVKILGYGCSFYFAISFDEKKVCCFSQFTPDNLFMRGALERVSVVTRKIAEMFYLIRKSIALTNAL